MDIYCRWIVKPTNQKCKFNETNISGVPNVGPDPVFGKHSSRQPLLRSALEKDYGYFAINKNTVHRERNTSFRIKK